MHPDPSSQELNSTGEASGIEQESTSDGNAIAQPFDPERIEVGTRSMTVDLLMSRIRSGAIDLAPDFQRRAGIWTDERQSRLIESLLLRIPLPTLYAAEDEVETWAIVDGIQRLTTIARFIDPDAIRESRLKLKGLEYLSKDFDGSEFTDLPPRLQRRLRETELVVHVIRYGTPDEVKFNIFARINTGGMPLSSQELRHALVPGNARQVLKQWAATDQFKGATDNSIKDDRMADRELVLRYIAFANTSYEKYTFKDFDDFLRRAMKDINAWNDARLRAMRANFIEAMETAKDIFGKHAFRKLYTLKSSRFPINKALFEAVAVALGSLTPDEQKQLCIRKKTVLERFMKLMADQKFDSSISQGTGDPSKVRYRFSAIDELFRGVLA
ncbi:DUF262 domain-containing protein [Dokdonella immobilis]|uniref:GmrSD restriction endonucleases N-terminal domain-containing protein n=1 Tax=Dokdonella immobilis TaxID=578942 RepID=A0A1I4YAC6_9GAMM|nr:DUF262 domain-containing protein [Dokdonella immobilis]SFN34753.1 Protein of unknown function DUF262 [Dokdonella immobilis]